MSFYQWDYLLLFLCVICNYLYCKAKLKHDLNRQLLTSIVALIILACVIFCFGIALLIDLKKQI